MKTITKKVLFVAALVTWNPGVSAKDFHLIQCQNQVIQNVCGDGETRITLREGGTFELYLGDVSCWGGPQKVYGFFEDAVDRRGNGFETQSFRLFRHESYQEVLIGYFEIDRKKSLADISLDEMYRINLQVRRNLYSFSSCRIASW